MALHPSYPVGLCLIGYWVVDKRSFPLVDKGRRDFSLGCVSSLVMVWWRRWFGSIYTRKCKEFMFFTFFIFGSCAPFNSYLTRGLLQRPEGFFTTFKHSTLPYNNFRHCFRILTAYYSEKNTHHPPPGRVVIQKWMYKGVDANLLYTKTK